MKNRKHYTSLLLAFLLLISCSSCSKKKYSEAAESSVSQEKYYGNFRFLVIKESWVLFQSRTYDSAYYDGVIKKFESSDSQNDLYIGSVGQEDTAKKITIEFMPNTNIIPIVAINSPKTI